ncbi:MAG TPA: hypothetical protein VMY37_26655 [Thermoguttaceae bacterium]|nr:hypothetical protein [Thermoguttaceae bacterium]
MVDEEETLLAIAACLQRAMEKPETSYGYYVLHIDQLPLECDPDNEHPVRIGLNWHTSISGESVWYELTHPEAGHKWHRDGLVNPKVWTMSGSCSDCPPFLFIEALSRKWPAVLFELGGTTEHVYYEEWEAIGGVLTELQKREWAYWDDMDIWYVKDGRKCDPPLLVHDYFEFDPDPEPDTFLGEDIPTFEDQGYGLSNADGQGIAASDGGADQTAPPSEHYDLDAELRRARELGEPRSDPDQEPEPIGAEPTDPPDCFHAFGTDRRREREALEEAGLINRPDEPEIDCSATITFPL